MEITVGRQPVDGMFELAVRFHESTPEGYGQSVEAIVWVDYRDSQKTMHEQARTRAREILSRALAALDA